MHSNFCSHPIIPRLLKESSGDAAERLRATHVPLRVAMCVALVCFSLVGFMGAGMFGGSVTQNVLQGFGPCRFKWVDVLSLLYACVIVINFPLVLYPLKTSLVQTFGEQIETKRGYKMSILVDAGFVGLALVVALFLESVVAIVGLFASIAGFFYFFFMPGYCFIVHKEIKRLFETAQTAEAGEREEFESAKMNSIHVNEILISRSENST